MLSLTTMQYLLEVETVATGLGIVQLDKPVQENQLYVNGAVPAVTVALS